MSAEFTELANKLSKRVKPQEPTSEKLEATEKIGQQMRFWPEEVAAMPTELTRVSLFGLPADRRGARKMMKSVQIESRSDVEVLYTGEQLGPKEETVWLGCLRLGRNIPLGERIYLNLTDLLRELKLTNTAGKRGNRQAVITRLDRLSAAHFKINFKRDGKNFSITTGMLKWGIEHETGAIYLRLDPDGAVLFENLSYQPWEVRLSLKSDLAAVLLSYISGHEQGKPHSQSLINLKKWCGYGGRLRNFRAACIIALKELEEKGVLVKDSSKITMNRRGDVASWVRTSTKTKQISKP